MARLPNWINDLRMIGNNEDNPMYGGYKFVPPPQPQALPPQPSFVPQPESQFQPEQIDTTFKGGQMPMASQYLMGGGLFGAQGQPQLQQPGMPPQVPQGQQAPGQQGQSFDQFYDENYNPMHQFLQRQFDTGTDEDRARRQSQIAKVLAVTNAMRPIADMYYNTGDRETAIAKHEDIGVMKAIDDYKNMLTKIDGKKQAYEAGVLQQKIRALEVFQNIKERDKDRAIRADERKDDVEFRNKQAELAEEKFREQIGMSKEQFEESKHQFDVNKGLQQQQINISKQQADTAAKRAEAYENYSRARINAQENTRNKAVEAWNNKQANFTEVEVNGKKIKVSEGLAWAVINKELGRPEYVNNPYIAPVGLIKVANGDAGRDEIISQFQQYYKNHYTEYEGRLIPNEQYENIQVVEYAANEVVKMNKTPEEKMEALIFLYQNLGMGVVEAEEKANKKLNPSKAVTPTDLNVDPTKPKSGFNQNQR